MSERKLTGEMIEKIIAWRERGRGYKWIAVQLGVSAGAIHYQCLKHGAISPRQFVREVPSVPSSFVGADGRTQRKFTQADDARMLELEASGMKYRHIAREIDRACTSVRIRLMTLAMRDEIAEIRAVQHHDRSEAA